MTDHVVKRGASIRMRPALWRSAFGAPSDIDLTNAVRIEHTIHRNGNLHYLNRDEAIIDAKRGLVDGPRVHFDTACDIWTSEVEIHWRNGEIETVPNEPEAFRVVDPDEPKPSTHLDKARQALTSAAAAAEAPTLRRELWETRRAMQALLDWCEHHDHDRP
jgi:hypothetical protein